MRKIALTSFAVTAMALLCGTASSYAQDLERTHAAVAQVEGMRRGEGPHKGDGDRHHPHRPPVIVVGVPIFVGPGYGSYYFGPPSDAYRTLDGFYYYCSQMGVYYPAVQDCPSGWTLIP